MSFIGLSTWSSFFGVLELPEVVKVSKYAEFMILYFRKAIPRISELLV